MLSAGLARRDQVYRVQYPDGAISKLMSAGEARTYSSIFGGKIHREPDAPRWYQFWKQWPIIKSS